MNAIVYALWLIKEIFVAGISLALAAFKPDNAVSYTHLTLPTIYSV